MTDAAERGNQKRLLFSDIRRGDPSAFDRRKQHTMGVTSSNKTVDVTEINCDGSVKITLALSASPDIVENPTDIVLVLDRSGSMTGAPYG